VSHRNFEKQLKEEETKKGGGGRGEVNKAISGAQEKTAEPQREQRYQAQVKRELHCTFARVCKPAKWKGKGPREMRHGVKSGTFREEKRNRFGVVMMGTLNARKKKPWGRGFPPAKKTFMTVKGQAVAQQMIMRLNVKIKKVFE